MYKAKYILIYSTPLIVLRKAREHGISGRKTHKYVYRPPNKAPVHFGAWGMEDYTKHKDRERLEAFRSRSWATAPREGSASRCRSNWLYW
jgi:hypothetical protein